MRILYGVFGYGRGHATRALGVLPALKARHEVVILAGGDAQDTITRAGYEVVPIETLAYAYGKRGERSLLTSLSANSAQIRDLLARGPTMRRVRELAQSFQPHVAICDAEPWLHRAASQLGIPRISFDHYGILAYGRPPVADRDRVRFYRDVVAYRLLMGRAERAIVSSFYETPTAPGVRLVGPILRDEVLARTSERSDTLLVYLNNGANQLIPSLEAALRVLRLPVVIYGSPRRGQSGNLEFRPPSNEGFLDDLARCRAVLSTAGNQLVGEAIYFKKPLLVVPEHTVEQRVNALAIERMGLGAQFSLRTLNASRIERFLAAEETYRANMVGNPDGRIEAVEAVESFARELATGRRLKAGEPSWSTA